MRILSNGELTENLQQDATRPQATEPVRPHAPTKPRSVRRRWITLSLRSLMVLILIIAAWLAWQVNRARGIRQAIALVSKAGGKVEFDKGDLTFGVRRYSAWMRRQLGDEYLREVVEVSFFNGMKWDEQAIMPSLSNFPRLQKLNLSDCPITDESIKTIAKLGELREIHIDSAYISDIGLAELRSLQKLERLNLWAYNCSGRTLVLLSTLPKLRSLELVSSPLTDDGVNALAGFMSLERLVVNHEPKDCRGRCRLPFECWSKMHSLELNWVRLKEDDWKNLGQLTNLEELELFWNDAEDRHLIHLRGLKKLKRLEITFASLTPEAVADLQKQLPSTIIETSDQPRNLR